MTTHITTISLSSDMARFCEQRKLKLSKILQTKIQELMDADSFNEKNFTELTRKIAGLQSTISQQRDFIEANGLMDKFLGL